MKPINLIVTLFIFVFLSSCKNDTSKAVEESKTAIKKTASNFLNVPAPKKPSAGYGP